MRRLCVLLFLLPLFLPAFNFAQTSGAHRIGQVVIKGNNVSANVAPYAKIQVCVAGTGCGTAATVYTNAALTNPATLPLTADGSGNYDYYIASGCVDESISSPGMGGLFLNNVCPFNGTAGGATLPTNAVVFGLTSATSRAATYSDIAGLFTGTTPCYLKSDGTCSTSTSGAAGSNLQAQYNGSGSFAASAATFDAAGDFVAKSLNGTPMPQLFQTGSGNNGINNALQTSGNVAVVNQGYASVEDPVTY